VPDVSARWKRAATGEGAYASAGRRCSIQDSSECEPSGVRWVAGHSNMEYASATDVGMRRSHNQDAHAVLTAADAEQWQQRGHVFVVADGMGAHAVGELASKLAADSIPHVYSKHAQEGPAVALRTAFIETNCTIHARGQQNRGFEGMGTTGTALLLRPEGAWLAHVGDSRAYRIRGGTIEQLTFDHSLVWELARRQGVRPEELRDKVPSNVIVRSLGPEPLVQVDIEGPHPIEAGDLFVLCSDGLSGQVSDREIGAVVRSLPPEEACRLLVDLANLHGGPDNITVIVAHIQGEPTPTRPARRRPRPLWPEWLPWPLVCLTLGILLAIGAIGMTRYHMEGRVPVFLLAAVALLAGLAGLLLQHRKEVQHEDTEEERPPPRIYRSADCSIGHDLIERLERAEVALESRLRENNAEASWDEFRTHREQGRAYLREGQLAPAFREQCRALAVLAEAFGRQRHRDEIFQPLWDKGT
jgi:serine/threonine protein phosphatase PrpC